MPLALFYDENFVLAEAWRGDLEELKRVAEEKVRRGEVRVAVVISCKSGGEASLEFFGEDFSGWVEERLPTILYRSVAEYVESAGTAEKIRLEDLLRDVLEKSKEGARKACRGGSS